MRTYVFHLSVDKLIFRFVETITTQPADIPVQVRDTAPAKCHGRKQGHTLFRVSDDALWRGETMAQLILSTENGTRSTTVYVTRDHRVIADVIRKFARQRGVSPLSVEYRIG